tara:strand:+ start:9685 stop:9930 length:246 start_codon:yes stop_codon:yes gene_type:complete
MDFIYSKLYHFDFYLDCGLEFIDGCEYSVEPMVDDDDEYDETYVVSGDFRHPTGAEGDYSMELTPEDYKLILKKVNKHFIE